jgi:hypothetical protein
MLLNDTAFEIIKQMREKGKNYKQIARYLTKLGYTSATDNKLTFRHVSIHALHNGMRLKKFPTRQKGNVATTNGVSHTGVEVTLPKLNCSLVEDIMSLTTTKEVKLKLKLLGAIL